MFSTGLTAALFCFWVVAILVHVDGSNDGSTATAHGRSSMNDDTHIEPEVHRYTNVLPRDVCEKIIELGEAAGFPLESDSIDAFEVKNNNNKYSQAIDVMDEKGRVLYPDIFEELEPYIETIEDLIRNQRDERLDRMIFPDQPENRKPRLGWIFYRKYAPESARNSLVPHYDSNMFTVNIALNDDFTGGGLFYVKPAADRNPEIYYPSEENNYFLGGDHDGVPDLEDHQYTYQWVNGLKHANTTEVVFPTLETGDALIHNYTVWHAVAPLEMGIRYSMVLFYDMHNPLLIEDEEYYSHNNDDEDEGFEEDFLEITIEHAIMECDPTTGKLVHIQDDIDTYWVSDYPDEPMEAVMLNQPPGFEEGHDSYVGHEFWAFRSVPEGEEPPPLRSREVLGKIVVQAGQFEYQFVSSFTTQDDCDGADLDEEEDEL